MGVAPILRGGGGCNLSCTPGKEDSNCFLGGKVETMLVTPLEDLVDGTLHQGPKDLGVGANHYERRVISEAHNFDPPPVGEETQHLIKTHIPHYWGEHPPPWGVPLVGTTV